MPLCRRRTRDFENGCAFVHLIEHGHVNTIHGQSAQLMKLLPEKAAALTIQSGCSPRALEVAKLQNLLLSQGAYLG